MAGCGSSDSIPTTPVGQQYLHVALDGSLGGDGSPNSPLLYPNGALERAFLEGYRGVKVASGDYLLYLGDVELRFYGGVDIIGGCDRQTWEPVAGHYSVLYALASPLKGLGIRDSTVVRGVELHGTRVSAHSASSCAVYLDGCGPGFRFEDCRFVARAGFDFDQPGSDGRQPSPATTPDSGGQGSCLESLLVSGGQPGTSGCTGGSGGSGGLPGAAGEDGRPACHESGVPGPAGGAPGLPGQDGWHGDDGEDGLNATASRRLGSLIGGNIVPPEPERSSSGRFGGGGSGGGGGGGSNTGTGSGGGGGGAGGYGGNLAIGGDHGGHSIAVICINSSVVFRRCAFVTATGGNGGDGGNGCLGATGPPGAPGGDACPDEVGRGGTGGDGGDGGASGGGAGGNGGSCFAVAVLGTVGPDLDETCIFTTGVPGQAGTGGLHGNGQSRAPDGFPGEANDLSVLVAKNGGLRLE